MMTTTQMIEVIKAYEEGKIIEYRKRWTSNEWDTALSPNWDFSCFEYRVKPEAPTRLEIANKLWKDTFGFEGFSANICPCPTTLCKNCELGINNPNGGDIPICDCSALEDWWNSPYTEKENK